MSWRTVVVSHRCKLDLCMNYLEVRSEDIKKIHLSEIHTHIIESTAVSLTAALLNELMHRKIKVIFCDEKRFPGAELIPYYGSHDSSGCIRQQLGWSSSTKGSIWAEIIADKIRKQQELLLEIGRSDKADLLEMYVNDIHEADSSNREGHAARAYFTGLFGDRFTRSQDNYINAALNYGYSILLSTFNKEIVAAGYLTQIGIFHDNMFNPFNLASDFMEPFRPLVDRTVLGMQHDKFDKDEKLNLLEILNDKVIIDRQEQYVTNAIRIYTHSILNALNDGNLDCLSFYSLNNPTFRRLNSNTGGSSILQDKVEKLISGGENKSEL